MIFEVHFTSLDHFCVHSYSIRYESEKNRKFDRKFEFWSLLDQFWRFLKVLEKIKKSKMADPSWPPFENRTSLWRHMTSSADVADLKGNVSGRTICPPSFVVITLIFSGMRGGGGIRPPSRSQKTKKNPIWIGLKLIIFLTSQDCRTSSNLESPLFFSSFSFQFWEIVMSGSVDNQEL